MIFVYTIALVLLAGYAFLIGFYYRSWKQLPVQGQPTANTFTPGTTASVIIPARNEANSIGACLDALLAQDYPRDLFELLVVDDHSDDSTASVVEHYKKKGVRLIRLQDQPFSAPPVSYKKKAIETGIAHAKGQLIITTDADCTTLPGWLSNICYLHENENAQLVAGPVKMNEKNGWFPAFQCLDFLTLQGITAASVYKGFHNMCNGANLAYTRHAFETVRGFHGIDHLASGDDMLLMHKIASRFPSQIRYMKSRQAVVSTDPAPGLRAFLRQRIRWASKAQVYEDKKVFRVLLLVYLLNLLLLAVICVAFFSWTGLYWALALLLIKTCIELPFVASVARFFGQGRLLPWFPLLQPLHILYTVIAGSFGQFGKYEWKGRTTH